LDCCQRRSQPASAARCSGRSQLWWSAVCSSGRSFCSWLCRRCRRCSWIAENRRPQQIRRRHNRARRSALTKRMHLRLVLSSVLLAALAANPCFAKDGHAHHGARAGVANSVGSGIDRNDASAADPAPSKADAPINAEAPVAPPVLPPRGVTQQQIRSINPDVKTANPGILSRSQAGAPPITAPTVRNAIGQPPAVSSALGASGATSLPILHAGPAAPPFISSGASRLYVSSATNRGSINGATVIRPTTSPSIIGGPARALYGINGTTVQNRH